MKHTTLNNGQIHPERGAQPSYAKTYVPVFPDEELLEETQAHLKKETPVATTGSIDYIRTVFARIAIGKSHEPIIISGNCSRPVDAGETIDTIVAQIDTQKDIIEETLGEQRPLHLSRDPNQNFKPRSEEFQRTTEGEIRYDRKGRPIPNFYGHGINGPSLHERTPDPRRLMASAVQARDIQAAYLDKGDRLLTAHEALVPEYEECFLVEDEGRKYLLSAELPWIGNRTRQIDSPQVRLLSGISNPVGIKIDHTITADEIEELYRTLNPRQQAGKIAFMPRLGAELAAETAYDIIGAIKTKAPGSLIISDPMHGNTIATKYGVKTRVVSDIIRELGIIKHVCDELGTKMHGIHLETSGLEEGIQCVDNSRQVRQAEKSLVDPQLNNQQLRKVLRAYGLLLATPEK